MGIHDRDYLREDPSATPPIVSFAPWFKFFTILFSIAVIYLCLRLPLISWLKVPLLVLVILWLRKVFHIPRRLQLDYHRKQGKLLETRQEYSRAIIHYKAILDLASWDSATAVRLLTVYDLDQQIPAVKGLIEEMNGKSFTDTEAEELKLILSKYRGFNFVKRGSRHVLQLA